LVKCISYDTEHQKRVYDKIKPPVSIQCNIALPERDTQRINYFSITLCLREILEKALTHFQKLYNVCIRTLLGIYDEVWP